MTPILEYILNYLAQKAPAHTARLRLWIAGLDASFEVKASWVFERYKSHIEKGGKSIDYGLDCYLQLRTRMVHERLEFLRSGRYANTSFADVAEQFYLNPEMFEYHMHGLVFAQFFWPEQYARFQFFQQHIHNCLAAGDRYLEVGGGHALYILEAAAHAPPGVRFQLVDISPSSIELAQGIAEGLRIDFRLLDIFDFSPEERFEFITMGEVIEHVENPLSLLVKARELLAPGGKAFISTPANSPTIDHLYLFNNEAEIREMLIEAGFKILQEITQFAESVSEERARKLKVAVMYAAFVESRS